MSRSLWREADAQQWSTSPLALRVYTSRLLGSDPSLVLHGGGNTSVKDKMVDILGHEHDVLWVKGSGGDLATIEEKHFAPVKMQSLLEMAKLARLSDADMVSAQRCAMLNPYAPNPSVEAILHAIIPFCYVDHTHADAVVTLTNTPHGLQRIKELYGSRVAVMPYVMPGFILAKEFYEWSRQLDWANTDGIILLNHGVLTFGHEARESYERMIDLVHKADVFWEKYDKQTSVVSADIKAQARDLAHVRHCVSQLRGVPVLARLIDHGVARDLACADHVLQSTQRGPVTPDHVIRTKRIPVIIKKVNDAQESLQHYAKEYRAYFECYQKPQLQCLDLAPRWAVLPKAGLVAFGDNVTALKIVEDIVCHTARAIVRAEKCDGWQPLPASDIFDVEYWELEQAKLKGQAAPSAFMGRIALVTGAAHGIGKACVQALSQAGAAVIALDKDPMLLEQGHTKNIYAVVCDVMDHEMLREAIEQGVCRFGGLDMVVSNVGVFPATQTIENLNERVWGDILNLNLSSHYVLLKETIPYLKKGWAPSFVVIGSKNVKAPGPGVAAYSVAKAGLTQLARVAALELAPEGVRVNVVHPNAVFDTALWTEEQLAQRAQSYGLSVENYKKNTLLRQPVYAADVASAVLALCSPAFAKTTGAQIPVDGGNDRVI